MRVQGAFDVARKLSENYPGLLFVMQNAVVTTAQASRAESPSRN
jgi:hypothetical protein